MYWHMKSIAIATKKLSTKMFCEVSFNCDYYNLILWVLFNFLNLIYYETFLQILHVDQYNYTI